MTLRKTSETAASIEAQLRQAREQIYQEQDEARRRWNGEQAERLEEARRQARELIQQSKMQLETEAAAVKRELAASTDALAERITKALLDKKVVA